MFRSDKVAAKLTCPVTILAGFDDSIIHPKRTLALADAFEQIKPEVYWFEAGHNTILSGCDFRRRYHFTLSQYD